MEKMHFDITINATPQKVWKILWNDDTYKAWTAAFSEGSRAESDWKKGSKILFLNAENDGMVSMIHDLVPNEFMSFKHIGVVNKGVESTDPEQTKDWSGSLENYTLKETGDSKTQLSVDMDTTKEYLEYFEKVWPQALDKIKALAEQA